MNELHNKLLSYRVDHLFILVGGNPLPCYVAGKLLVRDKGSIYLVYSTKTKGYANSLAEVFEGCKLVPLNDAERKPDKIFECIFSHSSELTDIVGLHYTGGTKVMSVHSYRAILAAHPEAICSYLDADRLKLCFERYGEAYGSPVKLEAADTNAAIGLKLQQLWHIHGKKPLREDHKEFSERTEVLIPGMADLLAEHISQPGWQIWIDAFKGATKLANIEAIGKLPFEDVVALLKNWKPTITTIGDIHKELGGRSKNYMGEGGDWLEDLVLQKLQELKDELSFNDVVCSARTQKMKKPSECEMELDVVAIRGYQLFVFSCYAGSNMDTCKAKLYEAAIRARQLGGSEARFALVCGHADKTKVEAQMSGTTAEQSFKVFDRYDLSSLKAKIRSWIREVDRETSQ